MKKALILKLTLAFLTLFLLFGCANHDVADLQIANTRAASDDLKDYPNQERNITTLIYESTGNLNVAADDSDKLWEKYFDSFSDSPYYFTQYDQIREELGENPVPIMVEGLGHKNPSVRWYCAYKIVEYLNSVDKAAVKIKLKSMLSDEHDFVKSAAGFALAVINKTYDAPGIVRSPNGKKVALLRFLETRYNGGSVLVSEGDSTFCVFKDLSVSGVIWSPDEKWLCVTQTARIWIDTSVVNLQTKDVLDPGVFQFISKNALRYDFAIGKIQRPDPYVQCVEWSPDSKKVLFSCLFTDDNYVKQNCLAVYDVSNKKIDWFLKLPPPESDHSPARKPEGFNWKSPDYGLLSGSISSDSSPWFDENAAKKADEAFTKFVDAINKKDAEALKSFTDPRMSYRFTDEGIKAVLEDYEAYFRNQNIVRTEFVSIHPYQERTLIYRAFNGDSLHKDINITLTDEGRFICTDNFIYYSGYAMALAAAFVERLKAGDKNALAHVLTVDDLEYPADKAAKVIENYKREFDLNSLQFKFTGNMTGDAGDGNFEYMICGYKGENKVEHRIEIVYGDGLVGIKDPYVPEIQ